RIWRLWAVSLPVDDGQPLTLVFEDIVYGSLVEALSRGNQDTKLRRHAVQIAEALRYLEKFQIVHGRLCLECCLLTYDSNVKLAVYGMSERSLLVEPKPNIDGDVETYRWLPPECIPSDDVPDVSDYDLSSMVYTFGLMLWSLFHAGVLPYENEKARNIRSRRRAPPAFEDGFMPPDFAQVCLECWNTSSEQRPTFKRLKQWIRDLQRESRL
ncbi:TK protein kinase, partial [Aphelenchoides avenae]